MTRTREQESVPLDVDRILKVGIGAIDPRLIAPDHREPDTDELIAHWTSCL